VTQGEDQIGEYHKNERSFRQWCKVSGGHLLTRHLLPRAFVRGVELHDRAKSNITALRFREAQLPAQSDFG
jgi:hypothetical protein